jgi:hypothetical protein
MCQEILDGLVREALQELSEYGRKIAIAEGDGSIEATSETQDI